MLLELSLFGTFRLRTREKNPKNSLWRKCGACPHHLWARKSVTITHTLMTGFSFQDKVLRMLYVWALCRDQDELNPYAAWRLLDISSSSTEQVLWEELHPRASCTSLEATPSLNLYPSAVWWTVGERGQTGSFSEEQAIRCALVIPIPIMNWTSLTYLPYILLCSIAL